MSFSLNKKHIIIVYHYVEDPRPDRTGIHPCSVAEFEKQVAFLSKNYRIGTLADVNEAALKKSAERVCSLTFDDGLRDQYENALPILEKYNVPGVFFIIGDALDGHIPETHMIHMLFSKLEPKELVNDYHGFVEKNFSQDAHELAIPTDCYLNDARRHSDIYSANFKERMLFLPEEVREQFFAWMSKKHKFDEKALSREFFMEEREVRDLVERGGIVGSHAQAHGSFDNQDREAIAENISGAKRRLESILGKASTSFSYPHGRIGKNTKETLSVLIENGFTHAVTVERGEVKEHDNPLLLPRYNSNDIRDFLNSRN